MSKHTPGPWFIGKSSKRKQYIDIDARSKDPDLDYTNWEGFARVYGCEDDPEKGFKKAKANARLIAAAPELLEALVEMTKLHRKHFGLDGAWDREIIKAESVIAKATGEQE